MTCCSYFKNGICVETLEDHIKVGLEFLKRRYLSRKYQNAIAKELGVDKNTVTNFLMVSYLLHDVAKGLKYYQKRRETFRGHEYYSSLIAVEALMPYGKEIALVIGAAVGLHHHDWIRYELPKVPRTKLTQECIEIVKKLSPIELTLPTQIPLTNYSSEIFEITSKRLKAVYLFLIPIVLADNYAALKNRGDERTILGKEVLQADEIYENIKKTLEVL